MRKLLIATSNIGKFKEMMAELADLSFKFVNLKDVGLDKFEVEEPHATTWQNAWEKAKFFAKKSGLLTIAEDTGLFVDYLKGAPGVHAKRFGPTALERNVKLLQKLKTAPAKQRTAYFETSICFYHPDIDNFSVFMGRAQGKIAKTMAQTTAREGLGYDAVFFYPSLKKTFAELSLLEKNKVSHRGQAIGRLKYFLMSQFSLRQVICAAGIIVKNKKMLMTKRRDLRPEFNNKWEFPGGGVENGETFIQTLVREVKEETGYAVKKVEQLPEIHTVTVNGGKEVYQVHLVLYVCQIKSGKFKPADAETCGSGWFTYQEALKMNMLPLNKKVIQAKENKKVLLKYVKFK